MSHESKINVSYPSWGTPIEEDLDLLQDSPEEDELVEIVLVDEGNEKIKRTGKIITDLGKSTIDILDEEDNFLFDDKSEEIFDEIFKETQEEQRELNKLIDMTKSKSTGLSLEMVDKLKEAAPEVFTSDNKKITMPNSKTLNIENEGDIINLMVIMAKYNDGTQSQPTDETIERRRQEEFLRQQEEERERERLELLERRRREEQARLEIQRQKEMEERKLREEQERLESERLERERLEREELARRLAEEEASKLILDDGSEMEEIQLEEEIQIEPLIEDNLYEEDEINLQPGEIEEFEEDESSTYSLKKLKKKVIIPEDTIM